MKKFNLFNEIIVVNKNTFVNALNSNKTFAIDTQGNIAYEPFDTTTPLIYKGKYTMQPSSALMSVQKIDISSSLGKNYQVVEDNDRLLIKAFSNWQELITINTPLASYDDTTADGVAEFAEKELEAIGWHGDEFNIEYRTLVELLEEKCDGLVLCIEQEEPYQFSGLGFISNHTQAKEILFEHCKAIVADKIANNEDFAKENLTDDEEDAAKFFGVL
jgi:hypothetical protein